MLRYLWGVTGGAVLSRDRFLMRSVADLILWLAGNPREAEGRESSDTGSPPVQANFLENERIAHYHRATEELGIGVVQVVVVESYRLDDGACVPLEHADGHLERLSPELPIHFHYPDRTIDIQPAFESIISSLKSNVRFPEHSLTLKVIMENASHDSLKIRDRSGFQYGFGTATYASAFEIALWIHIQRRSVAAVHKDFSQLKTLLGMCGGNYPFRPRGAGNSGLWDVPLCLFAQKALLERHFQHR